MKGFIRRIGSFLFVTLLSLLVIYRVESSAYIYASLLFLVYGIGAIFLNKNETVKLFHVYFNAVVLAFLLGEVYFSSITPDFLHEYEVKYGEGVHDYNDTIGFFSIKNSQRISRVTVDDAILYETTQTVDELGRRIMPKSNPRVGEAVLFFGCSFTFGDGVEDHESMPYRFQEAIKDEYKVLNLGYSAYGAHQMLNILENRGEVRGLEELKPKYAVYQAITDHVLRGTYSAYQKIGPKYLFDGNGSLEQVGVFNPGLSKLQNYLSKSALLQRIFFPEPRFTQEDFDLYLAMVVKSRDLFEKRYDGTFYCLLWEEETADKNLYEKIVEGLKKNNIEVIEVKDILPGYEENKAKYLFPVDGHPNALAHELISDYLVGFFSKRS